MTDKTKDKAPYNASDKSQVAAARKAAEERRRQELNDVRRIMHTEEGRRFMWGLLSRAHMYHTSFDPNNYKTVFNEGERNIGLQYVAQIHEACAHQYAVMVEENSKK